MEKDSFLNNENAVGNLVRIVVPSGITLVLISIIGMITFLCGSCMNSQTNQELTSLRKEHINRVYHEFMESKSSEQRCVLSTDIRKNMDNIWVISSDLNGIDPGAIALNNSMGVGEHFLCSK